jgi:cytosine/uracil/thiamine/allantoin permease
MKESFKIQNHFVAKGAEDVHKADAWLDNDDIRPLALHDRTWSKVTYFTFWFSATATGKLLVSPRLDSR